MDSINQLHDIKIHDKVLFASDDRQAYSFNYFKKQGTVLDIIRQTNEIYVKFENDMMISCERFRVILLDGKEQEEVDFEGQITEQKTISLGEMRNYLKKYHSFHEGNDFSISHRDDSKLVMLSNEKYVQLLKDLFSVEKVEKELTGVETISFNHTMKSVITPEQYVYLSFEIADWTFKTHLSPWNIQLNMLKSYDLDLYKEWGIF